MEKPLFSVPKGLPKMKQHKDITCELLFIEIVAVGFLGDCVCPVQRKADGCDPCPCHYAAEKAPVCILQSLSLFADVLLAFVSALIGLFVGRISDGLMVGIVYIKIVMIVFMAVPILYYLAGTGSKILA